MKQNSRGFTFTLLMHFLFVGIMGLSLAAGQAKSQEKDASDKGKDKVDKPAAKVPQSKARQAKSAWENQRKAEREKQQKAWESRAKTSDRNGGPKEGVHKDPEEGHHYPQTKPEDPCNNAGTPDEVKACRQARETLKHSK